jgi:hypothetical protein
MKINIAVDGVDYVLDVEKAIANKSLVRPYPLIPGDVYVPATDDNTINPLLLIQATYNDSYQLLGMGCSPNSNTFYKELHTKVEIAEFLKRINFVYSHNIAKEVIGLVDKT